MNIWAVPIFLNLNRSRRSEHDSFVKHDDTVDT